MTAARRDGAVDPPQALVRRAPVTREGFGFTSVRDGCGLGKSCVSVACVRVHACIPHAREHAKN